MDDVADIEDIDAEWLGNALDTEVRAVGIEQIGTGQTGAAYRLTLDAEGLPPTMIAKVAAGDEAARQRVGPGYRNEVGFYAHLRDGLDVRAPKCWHATISDDALRFTLLLEDLAPRVPGVQADGCSSSVQKPRSSTSPASTHPGGTIRRCTTSTSWRGRPRKARRSSGTW